MAIDQARPLRVVFKEVKSWQKRNINEFYEAMIKEQNKIQNDFKQHFGFQRFDAYPVSDYTFNDPHYRA